MINSLFFFFIGVFSFSLETVWIQWNVAVFGASSTSSGTALFAFFAGTALGYSYFSFRNIKSFHLFRIVLAAALLWTPFVYILLDLLPVAMLSSFYSKIAFTVFATLPVCFMLGAFFPIVTRTLSNRETVWLYAWNTAGSLAGVLLATFVLPPLIGYKFIYVTAATFLFAVITKYMAKNMILHGKSIENSSRNNEKDGSGGRLLFASFICGLAGILYETVLIRKISIATDNTVYSFGSVTFLYIFLSATASAFFSIVRFEDKIRGKLFSVLAAIAGLAVVFSAYRFVDYTGGLQTIVIDTASGSIRSMLLTIRLFLPSLAAVVLIFPLLLLLVPSGCSGIVLSLNMLGGALGALLGGVLLPEVAGFWGLTVLVVILYALLPFIVSPKSIWNVVPATLVFALIFGFRLWQLPVVTANAFSAGMDAPASVVDKMEGRHGVVSVVDFGSKRTIWLNSSYVLGGNRSVIDDMRLGFLPSLLAGHSGNSAAVIGIATGISLSGVALGDWARIDAVELIPEVATFANKYFSTDNGNVLQKNNVNVIVDDGRHFLRGKEGTYSMVVSDLFIPWQEGSASLYSLDHFRSVNNSLGDSAFFMLWLPMYEITKKEFDLIVRTLCSEFSVVSVWQNGFSSRTPVIGLCASTKPLCVDRIVNGFYALPDTLSADPLKRHEAALFSRCIGVVSKKYAGDGQLNTMDRPLLGYWAANADRLLLTGNRYIEEIERISKWSNGKMADAIEGWSGIHESWRSAGLLMTLSVHELLRGNRDMAYKFFDDYKTRMPELLHKP